MSKKRKKWYQRFLAAALLGACLCFAAACADAKPEGEGTAEESGDTQKGEEPENTDVSTETESDSTDISTETESDSTDISTEQALKIYEFVDVKGNRYKAELLTELPMCTYDFTRLTEQNGYKYYTDQAGNIQSKVGIDVSKYQSQVDWQQVKASGVDFVIIRLGFRGYGQEGKLVEDECFKKHIEEALEAGLEVGVYFFSQAIDEGEAVEEAQFVLDRIKEYPITCPVVFDTEEIKEAQARTDGLSSQQFTQNCIAFCDKIEEAGYDSMIYANMKWMAFTLDLTKLTAYEKWYADYEDRPQCPYEFSMWQYTEEGTVPGIEGNVDINLWFGE